MPGGWRQASYRNVTGQIWIVRSLHQYSPVLLSHHVFYRTPIALSISILPFHPQHQRAQNGGEDVVANQSQHDAVRPSNMLHLCPKWALRVESGIES